MGTTLIGCVWFLAGAPLLLAAPQQDAQPLPFVSPIFGGHTLLQRGKPNAIWGWSTPGAWSASKWLSAPRLLSPTLTAPGRRASSRSLAGGPYTLRIAGQKQAVEWTDVLVGDVWICAGQSNVQAKGGKPAEFAIAGDDRKCYWANVRVEGDVVVVSSLSVPDPKAVRYAWQANLAATLINGAAHATILEESSTCES